MCALMCVFFWALLEVGLVLGCLFFFVSLKVFEDENIHCHNNMDTISKTSIK